MGVSVCACVCVYVCVGLCFRRKVLWLYPTELKQLFHSGTASTAP